jgi:hypothetical protein
VRKSEGARQTAGPGLCFAEQVDALMSSANPLSRCRRPAVKGWIASLLVALLVLAEAFAVAHSYDSAAHANGQACAVCVGAASLGAAAVGAPLNVAAIIAAPALAIAALLLFFAAVPTRQYARGPPSLSFTF